MLGVWGLGMVICLMALLLLSKKAEHTAHVDDDGDDDDDGDYEEQEQEGRRLRISCR